MTIPVGTLIIAGPLGTWKLRRLGGVSVWIAGTCLFEGLFFIRLLVCPRVLPRSITQESAAVMGQRTGKLGHPFSLSIYISYSFSSL